MNNIVYNNLTDSMAKEINYEIDRKTWRPYTVGHYDQENQTTTTTYTSWGSRYTPEPIGNQYWISNPIVVEHPTKDLNIGDHVKLLFNPKVIMIIRSFNNPYYLCEGYNRGAYASGQYLRSQLMKIDQKYEEHRQKLKNNANSIVEEL